MHEVNLEEAKSSLPALVEAAIKGEEVVITDDGKPLARLVPIAPAKKKRVAGLNRGAIWTSEDFDEPLPDELWSGRE